MSSFAQRIATYVDAEIATAQRLEASGEGKTSFQHLERAHVLGQASTYHHVRVHVLMLRWSLRHRVWAEARGQLLRIVGAATKTALGWVPSGNTGGSNVSPFQPLPVPDDLATIISHAKRQA